MDQFKSLFITMSIFFLTLVACDSQEEASDIDQKTENIESTEDSMEDEWDEEGEDPGGVETFDPSSGYIDGVLLTLNSRECNTDEPTMVIGNEKWTYCRFYTDFEVVYIEYLSDSSKVEQRFALRNDSLVYVEEMEALFPLGEGGGDWREYYWIISKDTVVEYTGDGSGDIEVKSMDVKTAEMFKTWKSHRVKFDKIKVSLGFDGVMDVAAMLIYENFQMDNDTHLEKYMDEDTPLKITISYSDETKADKVIWCKTEDEKRQFFRDDYKSRGNSRLVNTLNNTAVFEPVSSYTKIYIQELVFSDDMILTEIKLLDILEE